MHSSGSMEGSPAHSALSLEHEDAVTKRAKLPCGYEPSEACNVQSDGLLTMYKEVVTKLYCAKLPAHEFLKVAYNEQ